jgi:arylsulfatase A-like enzyme
VSARGERPNILRRRPVRRAGWPRVAAVLLAVAFGLAVAAPAQAQPNLVVIVTDDQRWDTLAYMPTVQAELVGKGVTFRNAFVVNPLCCPSRASILTGKWSHTTGVWANAGRSAGGFQAFDDASTLPVWLDAVGYETTLVGKYLNGYDARFTEPSYVPPGWDRWFATWGHPQRYFGYTMTDGAAVTQYGSDPADYATDVLGAKAVRFIRESGPEPFFLYFLPKAPHITGDGDGRFSTDPAPRHVDRFAGLGPLQRANVNEEDVSDKPGFVRNRAPVGNENLAELREEQLESLLAVDDAIARMLAALKDTGKLANTLIVFTSDNGYGWGEHRWVQKSVPYEESLRVPLVLRWDRLGVTPRFEGRFALNVDLAPTIAAAAGFKVSGVEGRSLLPLVTGGPTTWRTSFLFEHYDRPWIVPSYCGFRDARWKYVQYATGEEELYDLRHDRRELRNVRGSVLRRALIMRFRDRVLRSRCRPPRFGRPLPLCSIRTGGGDDRIRGSGWRDWVCAGAGNDRIDVLGGRVDVVRCGPGLDRVRASRHDQLIDCEVRVA